MEEVFAQVARTASLLVEIAAVIVVSYGALEAFVKLLWIIVTPSTTHGERKTLWRRVSAREAAETPHTSEHSRGSLRLTLLPAPAVCKHGVARLNGGTPCR